MPAPNGHRLAKEGLTLGSPLAAVGSLVGSLEELSRPGDMKSDALFAWRLRRTSLPIFSTSS